MPQRSEFKVYPERLGAAGETISSCKSKVEALAERLADVQHNLKGSASSIGLLERSVASLQENIRYQARRMDQAAACVKFSASRYSNAERTILGQPLLKTNEIPSPGNRPSPGVSLDEVRKAAGKEIEDLRAKAGGNVVSAAGGAGAGSGVGGGKDKAGSGKDKAGSGKGGRVSSGGGTGAGSGVGGGKNKTGAGQEKNSGVRTGVSTGAGVAVGAAAAGAAGARWVNGHRTNSSGWDPGTWSYNSSSEEYGTAYIEKQDGKDVITGFEDKVSRTQSLKFLSDAKLSSYRGKKDGDFLDRNARRIYKLQKKASEALTSNTFEKKDPKDNRKDLKNDWSNRVWERKSVPKDPSKPDGPKKGTMERLMTSEDKRRNAFSKDIVGAKLVDWKKEVSWEGLGVRTESSFKHGSGSAGITLGKATAGIGASAGAYYVWKNGKRVLATGAEANVGASFTAIHADAKGNVGYAPDALKNVLGKDFNLASVEGGGEAKVGHVEATGGAKARYVDGKLEASLEGEAGAYAAKGSISGKAGLLGVKVGASIEGSVGVGVTAKVGFTGGKLRCEFGACLGLGGKVKFEIDVQGAVDAVKNGVTKAAVAVGKAAVAVGKAVANAAKTIFSGW